MRKWWVASIFVKMLASISILFCTCLPLEGKKVYATTMITVDQLQEGDYVQLGDEMFRSMGERRLVLLDFVDYILFDDHPNPDAANYIPNGRGFNTFDEDPRRTEREDKRSAINIYLNEHWKQNNLGHFLSILEREVDLVTLDEYNQISFFRSPEEDRGKNWWLKTPLDSTSFRVYYVAPSSVYATYASVSDRIMARPAITLKPGIQFHGAGTLQDPYNLVQALSIEMFPVANQYIPITEQELYTVITGTATPIRSTGVILEGTLGGITKRTSVSNGNWYLYWTNKELPEGEYTDITLSVFDPWEGSMSKEFKLYLSVGHHPPSNSSIQPVIKVIHALPFSVVVYDPHQAYIGRFEIAQSGGVSGIVEGVRVNGNNQEDEEGQYTRLSGILEHIPEEGITELELANGQKLHASSIEAAVFEASFELQMKE